MTAVPATVPLDPPADEARRALARVIAFLGYPAEWIYALERRERLAGRVWRDRDDLLRTMRD